MPTRNTGATSAAAAAIAGKTGKGAPNLAPINTTQIVSDAKALGQAAISDASSAATALLTAVGGSVGDAVPVFGKDVVALVQEFVPASFAPFIDPLLAVGASQTLPALEAEAQTAIKTGLGIAIARMESLL